MTHFRSMQEERTADKPPPPAAANALAERSRAERRLFWKSLYPHTIPLVPLLALLRIGYFKPDRELIHGLARATTPEKFRDEINDYVLNPANASWLRNRAKLRVSTRRVERFAILCLGPNTPVAGVRHDRRSAALAPDPRHSQRRP
jgi:hypothetical protein